MSKPLSEAALDAYYSAGLIPRTLDPNDLPTDLGKKEVLVDGRWVPQRRTIPETVRKG